MLQITKYSYDARKALQAAQNGQLKNWIDTGNWGDSKREYGPEVIKAIGSLIKPGKFYKSTGIQHYNLTAPAATMMLVHEHSTYQLRLYTTGGYVNADDLLMGSLETIEAAMRRNQNNDTVWKMEVYALHKVSTHVLRRPTKK